MPQVVPDVEPRNATILRTVPLIESATAECRRNRRCSIRILKDHRPQDSLFRIDAGLWDRVLERIPSLLGCQPMTDLSFEACKKDPRLPFTESRVLKHYDGADRRVLRSDGFGVPARDGRLSVADHSPAATEEAPLQLRLR